VAAAAAGKTAFKLTLLPGDGIGPEIMRVAVDCLNVVAKKERVSFTYQEALIGGSALDATGVPLPDDTLDKCKASDASCWLLSEATSGTACPRTCGRSGACWVCVRA